MNSQQAYEFMLLALCIWREARGEVVPTKFAGACFIVWLLLGGVGG